MWRTMILKQFQRLNIDYFLLLNQTCGETCLKRRVNFQHSQHHQDIHLTLRAAFCISQPMIRWWWTRVHSHASSYCVWVCTQTQQCFWAKCKNPSLPTILSQMAELIQLLQWKNISCTSSGSNVREDIIHKKDMYHCSLIKFWWFTWAAMPSVVHSAMFEFPHPLCQTFDMPSLSQVI